MLFFTQLQPGSVIPYEWYTKFTDKRGNPDLALISILSEIIYWYRPTETKDKKTGEIYYHTKFKGDIWQTSYSHFQKRFGFTHERIRRVFVKLENMKIISRELKSVIFNGQIYNNRLFIHLDKTFLASCFCSKQTQQAVIEQNNTFGADTTTIDVKQHILVKQHKKQEHIVVNTVGVSPLNNRDIYSNNKTNIINNRSIDSNSVNIKSESNFEKNKSNNSSPLTSGLSKLKQLFFHKPLKLKDFYPLTPEDCSVIRISSGRNFTDIAINEILQNLGKKLEKHEFRSKKGFMNYMSKVLASEMRDEVKVSGVDFKINANLSPILRKKKEAEEYLNKLELDPEISKEMHFKKKIAATLDPIKAYEVLNSYKFSSIVEEDSGRNKFIMHLNERVELTGVEQGVILKQAKASHETFVRGEIKTIDKLEINMPKAGSVKKTKSKKVKEFQGIWGIVSKELIKRYGWDIYNSWFAKLEARVENDDKSLILKAPTRFIKDWVEREYSGYIEAICSHRSLTYVIQN